MHAEGNITRSTVERLRVPYFASSVNILIYEEECRLQVVVFGSGWTRTGLLRKLYSVCRMKTMQ